MKFFCKNSGAREDAFTILEVMIALAIFFMCVFAILGLVSRSLSQARSLKPVEIDAMSALAELSLTNRLEEGPIPIEIIQDFEAMYPGYTIGGDITEILTNGYFRIDFYVGGLTSTKKGAATTMSAELFRPQSQQQGGLRLRR
jgi:Tfp pilus assembly protein PilV